MHFQTALENIQTMLDKKRIKRFNKRNDNYIKFEKVRRWKRRLDRTNKDRKDDSYHYHDDITREKEQEASEIIEEIKNHTLRLPYTDPKKPLPLNYFFFGFNSKSS